MENKPARQRIIHTQTLNKNRYLLSLLDEANEAGIISQLQVNHLHSQIMDILRDTILRYNAGKSSSIRTETAQQLLLSVFYCMDACCMEYASPMECLEQLQAEGAAVLYKKGLELVCSCTDSARKLLSEVKSGKIITKVQAYNDTLDYDLPEFFTGYSAIFSAHEAMCSFDYPIAHDDQAEQGVFYIWQYLKKLSMENEFCRKFTFADIESLLAGYGKTYKIHYPDYLLNIFEIILYNSVFSVIAGKSAKNIGLGYCDLQTLLRKLTGLDEKTHKCIISNAMREIQAQLNIVQPELMDYMFLSIVELCSRLRICLDNNSLDKLVIIA